MTVVTDYTLNAATSQITLGTDFASTTIEQILEIRNITKNCEIYTCKNPSARRLFADDPAERVGIDISLALGVISFYDSTVMADTDEIFIHIDSPDVNITNSSLVIDSTTPVSVSVDNTTSIDVNVTNSNLVGLSDVLTVYTDEVVALSTTTSSTAKDLRNVTYADIYIKNATSTNLTVNVYGSPDSAGTFKALVGTTTLNATTTTQDEIELDSCPNYLFFDLVNSDSSNAASVSISVQRTVSADVIRPYTDVLIVYSSESVGTSSTTSSTGQDVRGASFIIPYVKNATSADLTINIYGSYDLAGTIKTLVRSYALNTTTTQAGSPLTNCPNYLFFDLVNGDSSNAATVDVSVQRG